MASSSALTLLVEAIDSPHFSLSPLPNNLQLQLIIIIIEILVFPTLAMHLFRFEFSLLLILDRKSHRRPIVCYHPLAITRVYSTSCIFL